jgi:hypothetical protein
MDNFIFSIIEVFLHILKELLSKKFMMLSFFYTIIF